MQSQKEERRLNRAIRFWIWIIPFIFLLPHILFPVFDDEDYLFTIPSTILSLREILHGNIFNLWTQDLGFGTPLPFAQSLHFHPLGLLWVFLPMSLAYLLFVTFHYFWGAWGLSEIADDEGFSLQSRFLLHATFMLCSTTVLCLVTEFWSSNFTLWAGLPWMYLLTKRWIAAPSLRRTLLISLLIGWLSLVCHIGIVLTYLTAIGLYAALEGRHFSKQHILGIGIGISVVLPVISPKVFDLWQEKPRFPGYANINYSHAFPAIDQFFSALIQPFQRTLSHTNLLKTLTTTPSRLLFMGAPMFIAFFYFLVSNLIHRNQSRGMKLAVVALFSLFIMIIPGESFPRIFPGLWLFRDLFILFSLLYVLVQLEQPAWKKVEKGLFIAQLLHLCVYQGAYLKAGVERYFHSSEGGIYWVFKGNPGFNKIREMNRTDPGCWAWSPEVTQRARSKLPRDLGITYGTFAAAGICLRDHVYFKGISMDELYPSTNLMYGIIHSSHSLLVDRNLKNGLGMKYLLAHQSETEIRNWRKDAEIGEYIIYKNPDPVTRASVSRQNPLEWVSVESQRADCKGIYCADFSQRVKHVIPLPVDVVVKNGASILLTARSGAFPRNSFILTDFYYREGWQAKSSTGESLSVFPYAKGLLAISLGNSEPNQVRIRYDDFVRAILRSIAVLFLLVGVGISLKKP